MARLPTKPVARTITIPAAEMLRAIDKRLQSLVRQPDATTPGSQASTEIAQLLRAELAWEGTLRPGNPRPLAIGDTANSTVTSQPSLISPAAIAEFEQRAAALDALLAASREGQIDLSKYQGNIRLSGATDTPDISIGGKRTGLTLRRQPYGEGDAGKVSRRGYTQSTGPITGKVGAYQVSGTTTPVATGQLVPPPIPTPPKPSATPPTPRTPPPSTTPPWTMTTTAISTSDIPTYDMLRSYGVDEQTARHLAKNMTPERAEEWAIESGYLGYAGEGQLTSSSFNKTPPLAELKAILDAAMQSIERGLQLDDPEMQQRLQPLADSLGIHLNLMLALIGDQPDLFAEYITRAVEFANREGLQLAAVLEGQAIQREISEARTEDARLDRIARREEFLAKFDLDEQIFSTQIEQFNTSLAENIRQYEKTFTENVRQFEVSAGFEERRLDISEAEEARSRFAFEQRTLPINPTTIASHNSLLSRYFSWPGLTSDPDQQVEWAYNILRLAPPPPPPGFSVDQFGNYTQVQGVRDPALEDLILRQQVAVQQYAVHRQLAEAIVADDRQYRLGQRELEATRTQLQADLATNRIDSALELQIREHELRQRQDEIQNKQWSFSVLALLLANPQAYSVATEQGMLPMIQQITGLDIPPFVGSGMAPLDFRPTFTRRGRR